MHSDPWRIVEVRVPDSIVFGVGACEQLPSRMADFSAGPVLLVTDAGLVKSGVAERVKNLLASAGRKVVVFDEVEHDPSRETAEKCINEVKSSGAALVVGIGGGSPLDVAKLAAAVSVCEGRIEDYVGVNKLPSKGLPTILLPTTGGTGSEVTPIAVVSEKKRHLKLSVLSRHLYCDVAIVDPALAATCPPFVTACSGMDALAHAIEVFTSRSSVPLIDGLMLEAIRLVGKHLRDCVRDGSNMNARAGMSLAALYAGLGLGPINTTAVHALTSPLGATFDIPHGLANALLLPYVVEYNQPACQEKSARIAEALGTVENAKTEAPGPAAVNAVSGLAKDVGIPRRLRDVGVSKEAIPDLAERAMKMTRLLDNNPRAITLQDAMDIYYKAY